jgi:hypothetical protein
VKAGILPAFFCGDTGQLAGFASSDWPVSPLFSWGAAPQQVSLFSRWRSVVANGSMVCAKAV